MGWYAWMPFMECYHGLVSLDHGIEGVLSAESDTVDMTGGRGYTEKDWGAAFRRRGFGHRPTILIALAPR